MVRAQPRSEHSLCSSWPGHRGSLTPAGCCPSSVLAVMSLFKVAQAQRGRAAWGSSTWPEGRSRSVSPEGLGTPGQPRGGQPALSSSEDLSFVLTASSPAGCPLGVSRAGHAALTVILSCVCRAKENKETMTRVLQAQGIAPLGAESAIQPLGCTHSPADLLLGQSALRAVP